jgi:thymidylate kinase
MLVTISGCVGSGKSTVAHRIVETLERHGVRARYCRFQNLRCFALLKRKAPASAGAAADRHDPQPGSRRSGYRREGLTFWRASGYAARVLAFALYRMGRRSNEWLIVDRYFYDSFVHYELQRRSERLFAAALCRLIPTPDLPLLLVATPETIAARRPEYSPDYVALATDGYSRLPHRFEELVTVSTDPGQRSFERIERLLDQLVTRAVPVRQHAS